jgi:hypothetical protein
MKMMMTDSGPSKVFDIPNSRFSEMHHPAEHSSIDEANVLFKGKAVLW